MTPDWGRLRRAYEEGENIPGLSREYGIPESTLRGRARREKWEKPRPESRKPGKNNVEKGEQKDDCLCRVDNLADSMLTCLERAVKELDTVTRSVKEKVKREDGTDVTTDYTQILEGERGIVDRGGLKQLTGVLKDLKDILMLRSDADAREQEARIARLQKELEREGETEVIRVMMEGGCEDFAD